VSWPLLRLPEDLAVPSTLKVRVPLGMATAVTLPVKVTFWPSAAGLREEVSVVVVACWVPC